MKTILGIDQGNTHTRAVLSDMQGNLLGYGEGPGAQHTFHGIDRAMAAVSEAAQMAISRAGVQSPVIELIYGGYTGADWADEYTLLEENVRKLGLCDRNFVVNDCIVALRGGTDQPYGAILIAGSGGNCAIRAPDGREYIYGYYHDEELQGGSALVNRMLKAIFRAETGREHPTSLTRRVLTQCQLTTVDELLRAILEHRLSDLTFLEMTPILFEEAYQGDVVAQKIIHSFALGSAELVTAGLRRFGMTGLDVEVVISGRIFKAQGTLLVDTIRAAIQKEAPQARLVNARYEPVVGAVELGLEKAGVFIESQVKVNIEKTASALGLVRNPQENVIL